MTLASSVDVDLVITSLIREFIGPPCIVASQLSPDWTASLPFIRARRIPGGESSLGLTVAQFQVDVWSDDRKATSDLASQVVDGLAACWRNQTTTDAGYLVRFGSVNGPQGVLSDFNPQGVWQFTFTAAGSFRN